MIKKLLIFLFLGPLIVLGQDATKNETVETPKTKKGVSYVTFSVTPTLFIISPRWNFGYIQNINEKIKIGVNFGIGAENFIFKTYNYNFSEYFIWEVRPEVYIIHNPKSKVSIYNSIELFYINENALVKNSYYVNENDIGVYYQQADYNRQKIGVLANFGVFIPFSSYFGMNFYAGIGFKWRDNTYTNVIQADSNLYYEDHSWISYYRKEGLIFGFQPNFGVNLNLILQ